LRDERIPIGVEYAGKAAKAGFEILLNDGLALDAAEACTLSMENCEELNVD